MDSNVKINETVNVTEEVTNIYESSNKNTKYRKK